MELQKNLQQKTTSIQVKKSGEKAIDLLLSQKPVLTQYGASLTIGSTFGGPGLQSLVKSNGEAFVGMFILGLLKEFLISVPNSLNTDEIAWTADKIMSYCPNWSTDDLVLCLKNGMDGKYGPNQYHWKWSVFVEWVKKYETEKDNYSVKRHEEKKQAGAKMDQEIISLIPKELLEKFSKEKIIDTKKRNNLDFKIPKEIVDQGIEAVDSWIEKIRNKK